MSHVKAGGSSDNTHKSAGRRNGVKRFGGQKVNQGEVLVRQTGSTKVAGPGTYISRNYTVVFKHIKKPSFTGNTHPRTQVCVE